MQKSAEIDAKAIKYRQNKEKASPNEMAAGFD
jgi:hypothetical protein